MALDKRVPFNQRTDTGRFGYLGPDERPDGQEDLRPRIVYRFPFWKSEEERLRYERSASLCPVRASGSLTLDRYLSEIVKVAEGIAPQGEPLKAMCGRER